MVLIFLSCVWVAGIFLGTRLQLPPLLMLLAAFPWFFIFFSRRSWKKILFASLGIFLFISGAVYAYASLYHVDAGRVNFYNDLGSVEIKGTITAAPDVRDKSTHLTVSASEILEEDGWQRVGGEVLVFVPRYPEYHYGDVLQLKGDLQTPSQIDEFDYRGYLAHQGIYSVVYFPHVDVIGEGHGFQPLAWIFGLREKFSRTLAEVLPEPQASLAQGILLGIRGNIPADLNQDFVRSGTAHLLAISGVNIGIMAGILLGVGIWLFGRKRYLYVWLALVAVWFYTVITGLNPPVVRGAVMASIFLVAEALGRQRSGAVALTMAAAVMAGIRPYLLGDASFQLSFLAMAGLIFIYPALSNFGGKIVSDRIGEEGFLASSTNLAVDALGVTLAAIIAVWPLIAYYFGLFSLVGPLATFLATPVLPLIMCVGTLAVVAGLIWLPLAQIIGWVSWLFLSYMILVVRWLGTPSIASVRINWINPAFIIGYYIVLASLMFVHAKKGKLRGMVAGTAGFMKESVGSPSSLLRSVKWTIGPLAVIAVLIAYTAFTMPGANLRVSFLNVGQGDAILIQKGSRQVLVDGGPSPQAVTQELSRQMPFWDHSIDLVVLTHPHIDHLAGLLEVLQRYRVNRVLYPALDDDSMAYQEWDRQINDKKIKSTTAICGQAIDLGDGIIMKVLNPQPELVTGSISDMDNNSMVLLLKDGKVSFLLTADIMSETEWELLRQRADLSGTVLKVAHHGSDTSSTLRFLAVVDPRAAVISVGADNRYGLPDGPVVTGLGEKVGQANLYRTDINGTITFTTDGERLWVEKEK